MIDQLSILAFLLLLSGFFSSSETALFSISKTKARHFAKEQSKATDLIQKMKEDPHRLLSTILIGNNVVNVAASAIAASMTMELFPNYAISVATFVMTSLILVFGEVFPKSIATRNNLLIAKFTIFPIYWLSIILHPVIWILNFIPKLTGRIQKMPKVTEEELMTFVEAVEEEGEIKEEEKEFIHNLFEFDDTSASEIMTPRGDMYVVDVNRKLQIKDVVESGFSRIPVINEKVDQVIGILNIKDLFLQMASKDIQIDIRKIMRMPYFIPENKKIDKLVHQFKKGKHHLAIVVDEHGGVSGLITLEDALEELVGEISDETDKIEHAIIKNNDYEWVILGKTEIDEVNKMIDMEIPESSQYDTFSGYILDLIGRIPKEKEKISIGSHIVIVSEMEGNRIQKYLVKKLP